MHPDIFMKDLNLKNACTLICFILASVTSGCSQSNSETGASTVNNLIHKTGYLTCELGSIPEFVKYGKGKHTLLLIPGLGFNATVFDDFIKINNNNFKMYAITIPGYGNTKAPPMPDAGTSYGEQSWNKGVCDGIARLIEKEKIKKLIVVGHFVQGTQLALQIAINQPNIIEGVIILGGPAKYITIINGEPKEFPLKGTISYVDKITAPTWFQSIKKEDFDEGNYSAEIYSLQDEVGHELWKQSAAVSLPVMIRYLCEFFSADVRLDLNKVKCPVLVLRAMFNEKVLQDPINNYVKPQFIDSWEGTSSINSLIEVRDIHNAASFVWKDQPDEVYSAIKTFLSDKKKFPSTKK